jgi:hypothetical protein
MHRLLFLITFVAVVVPASNPSAVVAQSLIQVNPRALVSLHLPSLAQGLGCGFRLVARGGFVISSAQTNGVIPLVEIVSQLGGECRLSNPWRRDVTLYRNNRKAEDLSGDTLAFPTDRDETVVDRSQGVDARTREDPLMILQTGTFCVLLCSSVAYVPCSSVFVRG